MTDSSEREFVLVRDHAETLSSGVSLAPAGRVAEGDLDLSDDERVGADQWLVDDEVLVDVESFDPIEAPTLSDLKARASELEIEGRSKMNAEELAEAIAAREQEIAAAAADSGDSPEVTQ